MAVSPATNSSLCAHNLAAITSARTELRSMYGLIKSEWTLNKHSFDWQITVPANSIATVYVPAKDASQVTENGRSVEKVRGITFLRTENGFAVFEVEAGSYSFSSKSQS
jgi:alpha-L-rhamnosidase